MSALLAAVAILLLAGYFLLAKSNELEVRPATGTAQAMAAAGTK